jgi:hypothetical protein
MRSCWGIVLVAACGFHPSPVTGDGTTPFPEAGTGPGSDAQDDAPMPDDGLIAYYPMEAITAKSASDATGHGHDATCMLCPSVVAGHAGNGFLFDGTTRFDVVDAANAFDTSGFTVAAWVNFTALTYGGEDFGCPVGKVEDSTIYNTWELCYDKIHDAWIYDTTQVTLMNPAFDTMQVFPPPTTNRWYHTAMTWDGNTKALWLDGAMADSEANARVQFTDGGPVTFGADTDNGGQQSSPFVGVMDDLRIYDHALTAQEIATLAGH